MSAIGRTRRGELVISTKKVFTHLQFCCVLRAIAVQQCLGGLDARSHRRGLKLQCALGIIERQQRSTSQSENPCSVEQQSGTRRIIWRFCDSRVQRFDARQELLQPLELRQPLLYL